LFTDETHLEAPVRGASDFAREFVAVGPRDHAGRSLRDLDMNRRMFRYPCSFLIYSEAFDALPKPARDTFYRRLWEVLTANDDGGGNGKDIKKDDKKDDKKVKPNAFASLSRADREAILSILRQTKAGLPGYWQTSTPVRHNTLSTRHTAFLDPTTRHE